MSYRLNRFIFYIEKAALMTGGRFLLLLFILLMCRGQDWVQWGVFIWEGLLALTLFFLSLKFVEFGLLFFLKSKIATSLSRVWFYRGLLAASMSGALIPLFVFLTIVCAAVNVTPFWGDDGMDWCAAALEVTFFFLMGTLGSFIYGIYQDRNA